MKVNNLFDLTKVNGSYIVSENFYDAADRIIEKKESKFCKLSHAVKYVGENSLWIDDSTIQSLVDIYDVEYNLLEILEGKL